MTRVDFDPDSLDWKQFFEQQASQSGGGHYFQGDEYQRGGFGLGNVFKGLLRYLIPIGRSIGREGIAAAGRIAQDVSSGEDLKSSLKRQAGLSAKNLLNTAGEKIAKQTGSGKRRRRRTVKKGRRIGYRHNLAAIRNLRGGGKKRKRRTRKRRDALGIINV